MRVLHVIPSVSPLRGGPSFAVIAMVRALREAGVEAEIATTNDDGDGVMSVRLNDVADHQGVPVRFFQRASPPLRPLREFGYSRPLGKWLQQQVPRYDLLHVHAIFSYASTQAMRLARQCGTPYINRPLGQMCQWSLGQRAFKKRAYLALVERANLRGAAALHFTTELEREEAELAEPGLPGFVVPHGIALPEPVTEARARLRTQLKLSPDEPVILFMSRVHHKKGLEVLIPALGRIRDHRFTLALVGDADPPGYEAEVRGLLEAAGLTARTCRLPFASGEWKQTLLQGADLFALTSHSENFGVAVVEALAARLPVVISDGVALAGALREHSAGEVVSLDVSSVAATVARLLQNPAMARSQAVAGRRLVEAEFTWPSVAGRLRAEYARILSARK
ncbi:MAG: glycosyltransferase [Proteobacteria bacterium]|nr:glycosyltransferase [Pseudomonadota bacterium]